MTLILASSSAIRRQLLERAGVGFTAIPAGIDEAAVKARHDDPAKAASSLSQAKAQVVSSANPGAWVIGSDSIASVGVAMFDKPKDRSEAADHLRFFSGRTLRLTSAVSLSRDGQADWTSVDSASLEVRDLSEAFIESYLEVEWPEVGHCAGVFRLEAYGVHLFKRIGGSYFTILGMPLLPLLGALRGRGLIAG